MSLTVNQRAELRDPHSEFQDIQRIYPFAGLPMFRGQVQNAPARGDQILTVNGAFEAGFSLVDVHRHCAVTFGSAIDFDDISRRVVLNFNGVDTLTIDTQDITIPQFSTFTIWNLYPIWSKLAYAEYDDTLGTAIFYQDGKPPHLGGDGLLFDLDQWLRPSIRVNFAHLVRYNSAFPATIDFTPEVILTNNDASGYVLEVSVSPSNLCAISEPVPGTYRMTFTQHGEGYLHVKATDNVAGVTTIHRPVVYRPNSPDVGITEFSFSRPTDQINQVKATTQITVTSPDIVFSVENNLDWRQLRHDTLLLCTQSDFYRHGEFYITSDESLDENVILSGYIKSSVEEHVRSVDGSVISSVTLTVENIPSRYTYALSQTGKEIVTSFLEMVPERMGVAWLIFMILDSYSTFASLAEIVLPFGDLARRPGNELVTAGNIFEGIKRIADARVMDATFSFDHRLYVQYNLNFQDQTTRNAAPTTLTLEVDDLGPRSAFEVSHNQKNARFVLSGGTSSGNIDDPVDYFQPIIVTSSRIPESGADPRHPDIQKKMFVDLQDALTLVVRMHEVSNQRYSKVTLYGIPDRYHKVFKVGSNNQWINLGQVASPTDRANIRGDASDLVNRRCLVRSVSYPGDQTITVTLQPEAPVSGIVGIQLPNPEVPPQTSIDGGEPSFPTPFDYDPPAIPSVSPLIATDPLGGFWVWQGDTWIARNAGIPLTARYAKIDPWVYTLKNVDLTGFYLGGLGLVAYSANGGQGWTDLTGLVPTPPYTYGSVPAPEPETVEFTIVSANDYALNAFYMSAEWFDIPASVWRSWTLKRSEALAWTWVEGLAAQSNVPAIWWETIDSTETINSLLTWPEDQVPQAVAVTDTGTALQANANGFASNPSVKHEDLSALGFPDDTVLTPATPLAVSFRVTFDHWKNELSRGAVRLEQGGSNHIRADHQFTDNGGQVPGTWQSYDITFGGNIFTRYPGHPDGLLSNRNTLYLVFRLEGNGNRVKNIKWELLTSISGGGGQSRNLGQDIDRHTGDNLYKIEWDGVNLQFLRRLASDLTIGDQITLGLATSADVDTRVKYANTYCPPSIYGTNQWAYIYGLWNDGGGDHHLMLTKDGGLTINDIGDSVAWGANVVSEFFGVNEAELYAFTAGIGRALYRTLDGGLNWQSMGPLPFDVERASLGGDGKMVIINQIADPYQVAVSDGPIFSVWQNITTNISLNGKGSVVWV